MAVKTKDFNVADYNFNEDKTVTITKKHTALRIDNMTQEQAQNATYKIQDGKLLITSGGHTLTVENYQGIKYIKTDFQQINKKKSTFNLYDLITNGKIDNYSNPITDVNAKKLTIASTIYNDLIDASGVNGTLTKTIGKGKNKQIVDKTSNDAGIKINGGLGDDIITGTMYSDTFSGGKGENTINFVAVTDANTGIANFGNDIVNLTKGEKLNIYLHDTDGTTILTPTYERAKNAKGKFTNDLLIKTDKGTVTLKNYYTKETGATVIINGTVDLSKNANFSFYETNLDKKGAITTSALADNITINLTNPIKSTYNKKTGITTQYGATINSGAGDDVITGSNYIDTIKSGNGNDKINGSLGADNITGGAGENTINYTNINQLDGDKITLTKNETLNIDVKGITTDPNNITYKVSGKNLVVTVTDGTDTKSFTINNFGTKDITGVNGNVKLFYGSGENDYIDLRTTLLDELKITKNYTGTFHADNINAQNATKGLTINGGAGDDKIVGSKYNDTITGGLGTNTITYSLTNSDFGNDTIKLTKGETLNIVLDGVTLSGENPYSVAKNKKDVVVSTNKGNIILQNYYSKDIGAEVNINGVNLAETAKFATVNASNYFDKNPKKLVSSYTGSALADVVDASGIAQRKNAKGKFIDTGVTINSGSGDDDITGSDFNDTINAGKGTDTINAGAGNDSIYGGAGDDTINGGLGNNLIYLYKGDGADIIENGGGVDTLVFAKNTKLNYAQDKGNLVISYGDSDTVTLKDFYKSGHSVKYIQIGKTKTDISTLAPEAVVTEYNENDIHYILGTKNDDEIIASDSYTNIVIYGFDGNDTITVKNHGGDIYAGKGTDTIIMDGTSATANIHLTSGDGNNTLRFTDGNESKAVFLDFGENEIKCTKNENNLVIKYGDSDSLTIENYYTKTFNNMFSSVNINTLPIYVEGTEGSDTLSNDTKGTTYIYAGKGTDTINATNDVETNIFLSENDGTKNVNWTKGTHRLNIKVDSANLYSSAKLLKNNNNLEIQYSSNSTDKIVLTDFFTKSESDQTAYAQNINLSFGSVDDTGYTTRMLDYYMTVSGFDSLYGLNITGEGTITGTKFFDKIIGSDNADIITTGAGNDSITVNKGVDTININGTGRKDIYFNTDDGDLTVNFTAESNSSNVIALHIEGVTSFDNNNLKFYKQNNDLLIKTPNSESGKDTIKIVGYFSNANIPTVDNFKVYYEGDSEYSPISSFISHKGLIVAGSDGADNLTLPNGLNIVEPGKGDDTLTITATNNYYSDKIYISKGDGNDTVIYNTTGSGRSKYTQFFFDEGTTIELEKSGDNFLINHTTGDLKETVTVQNFDYEYSSFREIFIGDTKLNISSLLEDYGITINGSGAFSGLNQYVNKLNGSDGVDTITVGYGGSSTVNAGKEDDTIIFSANDSSVARGNYKLYFHNGDGNDTLQFNNNSFSSALNLYFDEDTAITTLKDGDNLLIKRSYVENEVTKNETVTLENYLSKQFNENLYINIGNNTTVLKTYVNQENVGVGTNKTYIVSNTDTNNTYTINNLPIDMVDVNIYDSAGSGDMMNISFNDHTELYIAFNIAKGGLNIIEDSLMILDRINYTKWQNNMNDTTIKGISIKGTDISAIETIKAKDNYYLSSTQLNTLKSNVASWLSTANSGSGYDSVADALASAEKADLITYIANQTNWQSAS